MNKDSRLYRRLLKIASIPSVSPSSEGENQAAQALYDELAQTDYFKENPDDLKLIPLLGDRFNRHFVFGMVRAPKPTSETVVLLGHMDVVSVEMFGSLREFAFSPEEYTKRLDPTSLGQDGAKDLLSGEWIFGRGVTDMKSGVCGAMELLMETAEDPSSTEVNIAVLFVPDEENNSLGMLSAVPFLAKLQDEGLSFRCCIDTEPTFATGEDAKPTVYLGSLGKINPFFYCVGVKAHAGEYYDGFSVGPTMARIALAIDGNPALTDQLDGTMYPPYAALKVDDMRDEYSATIMSRCAMAFSYLTSTKMPPEIMAELKSIAKESLDRSIEEHERAKKAYREQNGMALSPSCLSGTVYSVKEIMDLAESRGIVPVVSEEGDERARGMETISRLVDDLEMEGPLVVVGFLPPWYPHRSNMADIEGDPEVKEVASKLREKAVEQGLEMEIRTMFEGVSDLSYCGFTGTPEEARAFEDNMPGGRAIYSFPTDELLKLAIPILNFGPVGKDAHKRSERLYLPFYLDHYVNLLRYLVKSI